MIVVKIELHSAHTGKVTQLGLMHLSNDGKTTLKDANRGTYRADLFRKGFEKIQKTTVVEKWPRHSKTVWQLVQKALNGLYSKAPCSHPVSRRREIFNSLPMEEQHIVGVWCSKCGALQKLTAGRIQGSESAKYVAWEDPPWGWVKPSP